MEMSTETVNFALAIAAAIVFTPMVTVVVAGVVYHNFIK